MQTGSGPIATELAESAGRSCPRTRRAAQSAFQAESGVGNARGSGISRQGTATNPFVNPDLIAGGLSPLRPELAARAAGRLFLRELDRFARSKEDFAFETTLSGLTYLNRLRRWKGRVIGSQLSISAFRLHGSRFDVSPRRSNKVATMCRAEM